MSEFSFPHTAGAGGDSGPYSASFFADIIASLFYQNPTTRNNASVIFGTGNGTDDALAVTETTPVSNSIEIQIGKALVQGYFYYNDSPLELEVTANIDGSGFDRIDTVVLEIDFVNQTVRGDIVTGTPAAVPVAPTLTKTSSLYQVPIANIDVQNLFVTITDSEIDNTVKVNGIEWQVNHGGTGLNSVSEGDLLVGNNSATLDRLSTPASYQILVGDITQSLNMKWVGDLRPHVLRGTAGGSIGTSPTIVPFSSSDWVNPSGFITSLASNQFTLQEGVYIVEGFIEFVSDTVLTWGFWLADNSAPNTVLCATDWGNSSSTASFFNRQVFAPQLLVSTGVELFEIYGERSGAGTCNLATAGTTGMTPTYTPYSREIWFRKIN